MHEIDILKYVAEDLSVLAANEYSQEELNEYIDVLVDHYKETKTKEFIETLKNFKA